jgi:hypothetical protein
MIQNMSNPRKASTETYLLVAAGSALSAFCSLVPARNACALVLESDPVSSDVIVISLLSVSTQAHYDRFRQASFFCATAADQSLE